MSRCAGWRAGGVALALLFSTGSAMSMDRPDLSATLGAGYRIDKFSWNIAGDTNGANPNVLSELTWRDNEIAEIRAGGEVWTHDGRWGVLADFSYGQVVNGKAQDSDYSGDNRTGEFSRSINTAEGDVWGADLGMGYRTRWYDSVVNKYAVVILSAGYTWQEQYLRATHGMQVIPPDGSFPGLHTRYDTHWEGPWLGAQMDMDVTENLMLSLGIRYAWTDYSAEANWNLRNDLAHPVSFRHDSVGRGTVLSMGLRRSITPHWTLGAVFEMKDWAVDSGQDRSYVVDTGTGAVSTAYTRFNRADWLSRGVLFQAQYRF